MDCKVIIKPSIARMLLHKGNQIVDIKPNKDNKNATVFIFELTEKLKNDLNSMNEERTQNGMISWVLRN